MNENNEALFMGHTYNYWFALEKNATDLELSHLIEELGAAYAKIGFYERRIQEMAKLIK